MSALQTGYGRVVDRRIESARMVVAIARAARRFFHAVNRTPATEMAETIFCQRRAHAAAERKRIETITRYGGTVW